MSTNKFKKEEQKTTIKQEIKIEYNDNSCYLCKNSYGFDKGKIFTCLSCGIKMHLYCIG